MFLILRLPEDIIWFEPPIVCRWENAAESKLSESTESALELDANKSSVRASEDNRVVIDDFNLLNAPRGLDLYTLLQDFVVPRMPNGYIVKMGTSVVQPRESLEG